MNNNITGVSIQSVIDFFQSEISLLWIICGTIGNMISLIVLSMPKMRKHSTFTYLIVLAICDTLVLYFGLLRDFLVARYKMDIYGDFFCKLHAFSFYFVLHMASWLLVAVNIDRLVAVSFLGFSKKFCTPQVAMWVSLGLAFSLALINSHLIYFIDSNEDPLFMDESFQTNKTSKNYDSNKTNYLLLNQTMSLDNSLVASIPVNPYVYQRCLIRQQSPSYTYFFKHIFPWIDTSLQVIIPFGIMVLCNINVIHQVLFKRKSSKGKNMKRLKKIKGMCYMIVALSILFFILEAPVLIFICLMQESWMEDPFTQLIWTIINLMMYTNHVINFFSYCMTGTKFRRELLRLFMLKKCLTSTFPSFNWNFSSINSKPNRPQINFNQSHHDHYNHNQKDKRNGVIHNENENTIVERTRTVRKKNFRVNFENEIIQKENANQAMRDFNEMSIQDPELMFILSKFRNIESEDNSSDSAFSLVNNNGFNNAHNSKEIANSLTANKFSFKIKMKNFSKRKSKNFSENHDQTRVNNPRDMQDIDIELEDDDDEF